MCTLPFRGSPRQPVPRLCGGNAFGLEDADHPLRRLKCRLSGLCAVLRQYPGPTLFDAPELPFLALLRSNCRRSMLVEQVTGESDSTDYEDGVHRRPQSTVTSGSVRGRSKRRSAMPKRREATTGSRTDPRVAMAAAKALPRISSRLT